MFVGRARIHLRQGDAQTAKDLNAAARDDLESMGARRIAADIHKGSSSLEGDFLQAEARYRQARLVLEHRLK